jgi:hypothetical protein
VRVWDLRKKEMTACFSNHTAPVQSLAWNYVDSHLASSSAAGEILLHSLVSGVVVANFKPRDSLSIKSINFSPFRRQIIAAGAETGSLYLWDSNSRNLASTFAGVHNSPISAVAFSPVNHLLLCSAGLDQRIQFYDSNERKVVKTINAEGPLTSLNFNTDGFTIAAGSLYGAVYIYDLRGGINFQMSLTGHQGNSVNSLEFAKAYEASKPREGSGNRFKTIDEIRQEARGRHEQKKLSRPPGGSLGDVPTSDPVSLAPSPATSEPRKAWVDTQSVPRPEAPAFPRSEVAALPRSEVTTFPRPEVPTFPRSEVPTFPRPEVSNFAPMSEVGSTVRTVGPSVQRPEASSFSRPEAPSVFRSETPNAPRFPMKVEVPQSSQSLPQDPIQAAFQPPLDPSAYQRTAPAASQSAPRTPVSSYPASVASSIETPLGQPPPASRQSFTSESSLGQPQQVRFTEEQEEAIALMIESMLSTSNGVIRNELRDLHIEIVRQFTIQQVRLKQAD